MKVQSGSYRTSYEIVMHLKRVLLPYNLRDITLQQCQHAQILKPCQVGSPGKTWRMWTPARAATRALCAGPMRRSREARAPGSSSLLRVLSIICSTHKIQDSQHYYSAKHTLRRFRVIRKTSYGDGNTI